MQDFRTETFLDVCQTLNYTQSARRLNITQPAVSQHIAYLEHAYGTKLFAYQNRRLTLTQAGAFLRDTLSTLVHDEQLIRERIAALSESRTPLNFGVTLTAGEYVIARPLARFLSQKPDIQAKIIANDTKILLEMLCAGTIDCALVEGFFDKEEYDSEVFSTEELVAVCAPMHHWDNPPKKIEDLLAEHLVMREDGSGTRAVLEHALAARNLALDGFARTTEVTSINIIKTLVAEDYGITFLYESAVRAECEAGTLQKIQLADDPIKHDMTFIWLKGSIFANEFRNLVSDLATCAHQA